MPPVFNSIKGCVCFTKYKINGLGSIQKSMKGWFVGPRREMITPWSTNAVEITQNMGIKGISRIEEYFCVSSGKAQHDPMLQRIYDGLDQKIFTIDK